MGAPKLYSARDDLRRLFGGEYDVRMNKLCAMLRRIADRLGKDPFQFAVSEATKAGGTAGIEISVAALEITEGRA